jgi:hypothetical protein
MDKLPLLLCSKNITLLLLLLLSSDDSGNAAAQDQGFWMIAVVN